GALRLADHDPRAPGRPRVPATLTDRTGLLRSCDGAAARSGRLSARTRLRHGRAAVPRQTTTVRLARGGPGIPLDGWHQRFPPLLIDRRRSSARASAPPTLSGLSRPRRRSRRLARSGLA